ncbi:uncharacterized protein L199_006197 [Kwoniella botswanensis]|uniref:uncharacterized protein n=1 Tax=Kwoniella botswanensis TaxID=1268659 RepID=UPI00315DB323
MTRMISSTSPTSSIHYPNTSPISSSTRPLLSDQPDLELEDETESAVEHRREERVSMENQVDEGMIQVKGEDRITRFVWILVFTAALSGLLFGYDTAAISGVLVIIKDDLGGPLTDWQKEAITSSTTFGALLGGLLAGGLSDYTGRRLVIVLANVVFISGSLIQAACHSVTLMITGRFIVGLGVGLASCIVPLYIGELAPTKTRGRLVTMNAVVVTLGQVVAYAIGASFQNINNGWRWIVGLGALPAMIQLASIGFLPESPRILLLRSDVHSAHQILSKIYPLATTHQIDQKVEIMRRAVQQSKEITDRTTFRQRLESLLRIGGNRRALIIGCGLQISQQFCGFNTLMYYSATLFAVLGFKNATAVGMIVAFVNFLFTLVALRIIDPIGRRVTMLLTLPVMMVALILVAFFLHILTSETGGVLVVGAGYPISTSLLVLFSMLVYVAGYATGLGNIPWQQGELFRLEVRGIGTSISTATCWTGNLIIAGTFLSLMNAITPSGAFGLYAFFCTLSWLFCYFLYPETSGLSLEEVSFVFEDDFGVLKSQRIRREKLEKAKMAEVDRLIGNEVGV